MLARRNDKPVILVVIDGWGIGAEHQGNAIHLAQTPFFDTLGATHWLQLNASGPSVGLPEGQHGNSEAGHMNLGAGRIVKQDDLRIQGAIDDGTFFTNPALVEAVQHAKRRHSRLHIIGLLTDTQSAHADPIHVYALLDLCARHNVSEVFLHLFTDGRDAPPHHAITLLQRLREKMQPNHKIASLCGRVYAMDRKKEWTHTQKAYQLITEGIGEKARTSEEAVSRNYNKGETDEFMAPSVIIDENGKPIATIRDNDSIIFFNLRSDRARQLTKAFMQSDFESANPGAFTRGVKLEGLRFIAMTDFGPSLGDILSAFPTVDVLNTLPSAMKQYRQLYLAESEKFAHITFFFNGGYAHAVGGEDRQMIPSPDLMHYQEQPAMATFELIDIAIDNLQKRRYDFQCLNIAAPDMIAHTGDLHATIKAVEATDQAIAKLSRALEKEGGHLLITADHGNAEEVMNPETSEMDTEHSSALVPLYLLSPIFRLQSDTGSDLVLGNVAPTILDIFGVEKPKEMICDSVLA